MLKFPKDFVWVPQLLDHRQKDEYLVTVKEIISGIIGTK